MRTTNEREEIIKSGRVCLPLEITPVSNGAIVTHLCGNPDVICREGRRVLIQRIAVEVPLDLDVRAQAGAPYIMINLEEEP